MKTDNCRQISKLKKMAHKITHKNLKMFILNLADFLSLFIKALDCTSPELVHLSNLICGEVNETKCIVSG